MSGTVDAMAPVFDRHEEEVGARLRLRRGVSEINAGREVRVARDSWRQSDAGRKLSRDDGLGDLDGDLDGDGDGDGDGDSDDDNSDDDGLGGLVASPFAFNPLTTLPALSTSTAPTFFLTTEAPTATSTPTSTLSLLSSSASDAAAVNPEVSITPVVTVSSVVVLTTTTTSSSSPSSSSATETSSYVDSTATSYTYSHSCTTSSGPTAAFDNAFPSPTIFLDDSNDDDHHHGSGYGPPPGGLNPTAEDALISAGSIGAFILVCFICWMGWRMYKKSRRMGNGMDDGDDYFSAPNALLAKIPYFGRNQRAWQDLDGRGSPPMYERAKSGIYSRANEQTLARSPSKQLPPSLPQLDTNVSYSNINPFSASPGDTNSTRSAQSPQDLTMRNAAPFSQQPSRILPPLQTTFSPASQTKNPFTLSEGLAASDPNSAAQYGAGTMQTFETASSDRSRMPDPIYNQSELARQASTAYDPARRAVYRASELSSISSGFGDGDIIVPPPAALQQGLAPRPPSFAKSVVHRSEEESRGQRDTVYTTTSEDMPARYRSVNSWVNQQTGRIQRQQQSAGGEDVPPVPSLPAEERFTMMMDDEEPRRYEDAMSPQPSVPALPSKGEAQQQQSQRPASMASINENGNKDPSQRPLSMPTSPSDAKP